MTGFVLAFTLSSILFTVQKTVLDASWYRQSVEQNNSYERLYDRVLTDPAVERETHDLLAGLPIDHSLISANVRFVLPPAALRATVNRTLQTMVDYLRGDRTTFDPFYALEPVFDHIRTLAEEYLADAVTNLQPLGSNTVGQFAVNLLQFANDLGAGRRPKGLPTIPFSPDQIGLVSTILLGPLPPADRDRLRVPLSGALATGDLAGALAVVAPSYAKANTERFIVDLRQDAHGTHVHVDDTVTGVDNATVVIDLSRIRFLAGTALPILLVASALAAVACLVALGGLARRARRSSALVCSAAVIGTASAVGLAYLVIRLVVGSPYRDVFGNSGVPHELQRLLGDIAGSLFAGVDRAFGETLLVAVIPAGLVALVAAAPWVARRVEALSPRRTVAVTAVIGTLVLVTGAGLALVISPAGAAVRHCNGRAELCDRRYDQIAFPESHNAMSVSDLGWLGANQDVPMLAQLDRGVRVLHIDTRYWETPEVTASFASSLPPELRGVVLYLAGAVNPVQPGVWLCHSLCRLGSMKLETGLRQISSFVRSHPDDVLTLDIEDQVSAADTIDVFRRSGLLRYVYTPGDPKQPWPTLRQMLDSGRRVVVFAEKHGGMPRWYANLYRYAMETPYTFAGASEFSCAPNRGGTGKRLFVLNHFITRDAPSRSDAAIVNTRAAILRRARHCAAQRHHLPNFVSVNFSTLGDLPGAVDVLNGVDRSKS